MNGSLHSIVIRNSLREDAVEPSLGRFELDNIIGQGFIRICLRKQVLNLNPTCSLQGNLIVIFTFKTESRISALGIAEVVDMINNWSYQVVNGRQPIINPKR